MASGTSSRVRGSSDAIFVLKNSVGSNASDRTEQKRPAVVAIALAAVSLLSLFSTVIFLVEVLELCAFENLSHDFISLATRPSFDVDCYNGFIVDTMSSFPCTNFLETDAMLLEFADDLDNLAGRLSWVGDNLRSSSQPSTTSTPRRPNGQIPMTIAPGAKKPISSHVVCFNQAISVCVRKTFPVRCLKWADVGKEYIKWFFVLDFNDQAMNRFVEHQMLRTFKEFQGDCHKNFKATPRRLMPTPKPIGGTSNHGRTRLLDRSSLIITVAGQSPFYNDSMNLLSKEASRSTNQMLELQSQPTSKGSQPLSRAEICEMDPRCRMVYEAH
uniref:CACTA en-spm transposon protein n=1 Tax=Cucumis melo TaxID=3656 RepID=A0A9I9EAI8_CUCME